MFDTLLIANRGEIACRIIATARRIGLRTVAVFSEADAGAQHVAMADKAVAIGPAPAADSYLRGDRIIQAALQTGAQAIHPGYGFLSENPDFAMAVQDAGLTFIGPPASAIRAMGLKDAAKALMERAGVPVVPGYHGADQDAGMMAAQAAAIGYPVLIKARAGGGGRGMRLVDRPEDFPAALQSARREAQAAFGDPACLIERYVPRPRHIEIQVFADRHGNVVHLFERDCSLQRRHQKVIEEAPAPGMTPEVRAAMGRAAVEAARAIGYVGAGTVEFIVDGTGPPRAGGFWFMEMNTRLQVEHPVTEAITGLDLVELQLRVAAGEPLPFAQDDLRIDGWAFEARVYAEDPGRGFLPATGRLDHLRFPQGPAFARGPVRIDAGVRPGDEVSPWYDPMIAKVIAHGPDRATALRRLAAALDACRLAGTVTNLGFLAALARHPGFARGEVDTGLIARDLATLLPDPIAQPATVAAAALAALGLDRPPEGASPFDCLRGFRLWGAARWQVALDHGGARLDIAVTDAGDGRLAVAFGDRALTVAPGPGGLDLGGRIVGVEVLRHGNRLTVFHDGRRDDFALPDPLAGRTEDGPGGDRVTAPMPGLLRSLTVAPGAQVMRGQALAVLEAMKMEHTLTAPRDGTVAEVPAREGDRLAAGAVILTLGPGDG